MKADAVIFDKDGTLVDFDAFWISVTQAALTQVLTDLGRTDVPTEPILEALGVRDGTTDINGVLCKGTYREIGEIVYEFLRRHGCTLSCEETVARVLEAYNSSMQAGEVRPTSPALTAMLTSLKEQGKKLAVVTTDNEPITRLCLQKLGIEALFDKIYTDDGRTPTKPDPYCAEDFCRLTGVPKDRTVMVGDTMTDVRFARNAGICVVSIAQNEQSRTVLLPHADVVITDMTQLADILE